ncbi:hypothetical protein EIK77_002451 [Talaromyces pinophilus]|nr:hypothetical protein EIK77_002451 [Talaromyces pinophilus]
MAPQYSHLQPPLWILSLFSCLGHSLKLQPIISTTSTTLNAGAVHTTSLDLQTSESFLWGDETESIVNLERLQDSTKSIQCSNNTVTLQFDDTSAYAQLHSQWSWTNQAARNTLILVAGAGQCGWNEDRQPFSISSIDYNNATATAVLSGSRVEWSDIASNYHLHVGALPPTDLARRDYTGDYALDFNHQLGFGNWSFPIDPKFSVGLTCKTCYTAGDFAFDFDIKTKLGIPVDATLTIVPQDVSVVLDPTISLSGNIGDSLSFKDKFLRIPIDGITIASIVDLGPEIAFTGALNIGPLKGTASVTTGVNVSVENSAEMYIDLLSPSNFKASGWTPQVAGLTPTVSASIGAGISLSLLADVEFDLTVLGKIALEKH